MNSRLTKAGTTGHEYDSANDPIKIASSTCTYTAANEFETGTGFKYTYDERLAAEAAAEAAMWAAFEAEGPEEEWGEEEGWEIEDAAFGPSPVERTAGVFTQPDTEAGTNGEARTVLVCTPGSKSACVEMVCMLDKDTKPTFSHSNGYDYFEICGKDGHRKGYLKVKDNAVFHFKKSRSLFSRIAKAAIGTALIAGSVYIVGLCSEVGPEAAAHCVVGVSGGVLAGGLMWEAAAE